MGVIAAYFDESKGPEGYVAVAGYAAPVELWDESFSPDWWSVLKDFGVPEFKASDCRNGFGHFKGWSIEKRNLLTKQLVSVIGDPCRPKSQMIGIGAGMVVTRRGMKQLEPVSYLTCLQHVVLRTLSLIAASRNDTIQFVFDERDDLSHAAYELFDGAVDKLSPRIETSFRGSVRKPHFAPSEELAPLQAADLLAYETYKEMKNREETPDRPVSIALQRLVAERQHVAYYSNLSQTRAFIEGVALWDAAGLPQDSYPGGIKLSTVYLSDYTTAMIRPAGGFSWLRRLFGI